MTRRINRQVTFLISLALATSAVPPSLALVDEQFTFNQCWSSLLNTTRYTINTFTVRFVKLTPALAVPSVPRLSSMVELLLC